VLQARSPDALLTFACSDLKTEADFVSRFCAYVDNQRQFENARRGAHWSDLANSRLTDQVCS
jgi:hypothetical protein